MDTKYNSQFLNSVFQVLPRNMYFGSSRATSIDLCVRELVKASRFQPTTTVLSREIDDPFADMAVDYLPRSSHAKTFLQSNHVARKAYRERPDIIVVQQHLPTAAAIARRLPWAKIVLHTHNFRKACPIDGTLKSRVRRLLHKRFYAQLAGIIHVSEACARAFAQNWPEVSVPQQVVNNGINCSDWHPAPSRTKEILCVGRCVPEKGGLEAAAAVASVLPEAPDWRVRFILSGASLQPDYFARIQDALAPLGDRATIELQRPWEEVKRAYERAAIALVPSKCAEAFGRTALEAHAGGAALISSGTGGLPEVSGENALMLPEVTPEAIAAALRTLISNGSLRERLALAGTKRVRERFDIHVQAARMDDFLALVVGLRQSSTEPETQAEAGRTPFLNLTRMGLKRGGEAS